MGKILVLLVYFCWAGIGFGSEETKTLRSLQLDPLHVSLPDFEVGDSEGKKFLLGSAIKPPAILHFWATWCGPCQKELPTFFKLSEKGSGLNIRIFSVSIDHKKDRAKALDYFSKLTGGASIFWMLADDPDLSNGKALWAWGLPVTYFLNADGIVFARAKGFHDWSSFTRDNLQKIFSISETMKKQDGT